MGAGVDIGTYAGAGAGVGGWTGMNAGPAGGVVAWGDGGTWIGWEVVADVRARSAADRNATASAFAGSRASTA